MFILNFTHTFILCFNEDNNWRYELWMFSRVSLLFHSGKKWDSSPNGNFRILKWRYLPHIRPKKKGYVRGYPPKIWPYMVQYLHFRILEFPLIIWFLNLLNGWCVWCTPQSIGQSSFSISYWRYNWYNNGRQKGSGYNPFGYIIGGIPSGKLT